MPKFNVPIVRTSYQHATIEVEASNQEEANKAALNEAGDHLYKENSADYFLEDEPSIEENCLADISQLLDVVEMAYERSSSRRQLTNKQSASLHDTLCAFGRRG